MALPEDPEQALVARSRVGDHDAFAELVRRHERRVFRQAGRFFRRHEDVEDAAQETFLTAWRKLHTYRAEAPLEAWLTRICLNTCYARLKRERPAASPLPAIDPAAPPHPGDARLEVEKLLAALPPADRFILLLLDGEGWSTAEIAARLGWTAVNVKVRAHRARRRLRQRLERGGGQ